MQPTATAPKVMHEKEYATCAICHKYKGCWTDSGICSDCDEAEDERKMAENEEDEATDSAAASSQPMSLGNQSHERRLLDKVRGARAAVTGPFLFGAPSAYDKYMAQQALEAAQDDLKAFYATIATR